MRPAHRLLTLACAVALASCDSSPTAPPTPAIAVSQTALSLDRTATAQITATSMVSNTSTDITATATWRSSNEQVARVAAGLVTAVGPGTATITVEHGGRNQPVTVTVRRRVALAGSIEVTDQHGGRGTIETLFIYINDHEVGGRGTSSPATVLTAPFGQVESLRPHLSPGQHSFRVRIDTPSWDAVSEHNFVVAFPSPIRIVDKDTGEEIGTMPLESRTVASGEDPDVAWTFSLNAFTS